jgi:predicted N-acetyltransferase YhbS
MTRPGCWRECSLAIVCHGGRRWPVNEDDELKLRVARPEDFSFCERTYFEPMRATIEKLGLDEASHRANFVNRWQVDQVRIVMMNGEVIGWLQTAVTNDALFLAQLFVDTSRQQRGIGSRLMGILIEEATRENKAVTLGVVKTSPARRLYERLRVTHEDQYKFYMRRPPDWTSAERQYPAGRTR